MKPLLKFKCPACGDILEREVAPTRVYVVSYCGESNRSVRAYRVKNAVKRKAK